MQLRAGVHGQRRSLSDGVLAHDIVETSSEAFVGIGTDGAVEDWSSAAEQLFGLPRDEVVGRGLERLVRRGSFSPPGPTGLAELLLHPPRDERDVVRSLAIAASGAIVPVEVSLGRGAGPSGWSTRAFVRDLSRWEHLEPAQPRDPLTRLPTATALPEMIGAALAASAASGRLVAVVHVDVDRTGLVNEALGHAAGDELLTVVAERLAAATRRPKRVVRYGGDEFVAIVDQLATREDGAELAARVVRVLGGRALVARRELFPSASIGVALADPRVEHDAASLLARAALAGRHAKRRGGAGFELFQPAESPGAIPQLELEADLRVAAERGQLRLHYQPIVATDGSPWGVEALVRWQHPERGLVGPAEFLAIAEATGLVAGIGDWVLRDGARQVVAWQAQAPQLRLAVNLSPRQLADPELAPRVRQILDEEGLAPQALSVEVTEAGLLGWSTSAAATLAALAGTGVSVTLEEFGTGRASLLYLRRFPLERVKLGRYFLAGVARDAAAVGSVTTLAHALGLGVGAGGVETTGDLDLLERAGCNLVQGHLVAPPAPADQIGQLLAGPLPLRRKQLAPAGAAPPGAMAGPAGVARAPGPAASAPPAPRLPGERRVLVAGVEGEERDELCAALARAGLAVVAVASSPEGALAATEADAPDVVVLDLSTSGDHGLHLLPELARRAPSARLVVRSAFATPAVVRALEAGGADLCLPAQLASDRVAAALAELAPLDAPRPVAALEQSSAPGKPALALASRRAVAPGRPESVLDAFLEHALSGRAVDASSCVVDLRRAGAEFDDVAGRVLARADAEVRGRLHEGSISAAEASVAVTVATSALHALAAVAPPAQSLGMVMHAYPDDEQCLFPGLLVAEGLRQRGWRVLGLGGVSGAELAGALRRRPGALVLSSSSPWLLDEAAALIDAAHYAAVRVLACGAAFGADGRRAGQLGADGAVEDPGEATRLILGWRRRLDPRLGFKMVVRGARASEIGARAGELARAASAPAAERVARLVEIGVRGALGALLVDDVAVLGEVASCLQVMARSQPSTPDLGAELRAAGRRLDGLEPHGVASTQVAALAELCAAR